ncbi:hypothetical protein COU36_00820, partial [Candidatus Micrarchaeota archaeon CG10_big_fil_rev_8_21_14_0_10_59_7]
MLLELASLVVALLVLAKASEYAIGHAIVVARFLRISEMAIGFLLVSTATSMPEFFVGITASSAGETGISVGNVLGANVADLLLVGGATALAGTVVLRRKEIPELLKMLFAITVLSVIVLLPLGRFSGILLLLVFTGYAVYLLQKKVSEHMDGGRSVSRKEALASGALFFASMAVVVVCANFVVSSAVAIATAFNVSRAFIAGTLVSMGTTLPELATSVTAVRKKLSGIAIGNVVGSCITNLTLVLGAAAVVTPIRTDLPAFMNLAVFALLSCAMFWIFVKNRRLSRREGFMLLG